MDDARARARQFTNDIGKLQHREFNRIADVDGPNNLVRRSHQAHEPVDEIVDVAERARLRAVAVDRDVASEQRLDDEVRHDPAVVRMHARPVGVEDACDLDAQFVLTPIIEEQSFRAALAFIVARARPDRIDVAPVVLGLRMHVRVAVNFRRRGLQDFRLSPAWQGPAC